MKEGEEMPFFYTWKKDENKEERWEFLRILYHDKRGGQMILLQTDGLTPSKQYSTCDIEDLMATGTDGTQAVYTSVNTFRGNKRSSAELFNVGALYFDLDCHLESSEKIADAKKRAVMLLENAFSAGMMSPPTMITDTGRGFGLYYVLKQSIANVDRTRSQKAFFDTVRQQIFEKLKQLLATDPLAAQADPAVLDDARICRMPGSFNLKAKAYCHLICVTGEYYELSDLVKGFKLWDWLDDNSYRKEKEKKKNHPKKKVVSIAEYKYPFLKNRIKQLQKIQDLRGADCTDNCRELLLFIAYSAFTQLDHSSAVAQLQALNGGFVNPLEQKELDHIVKETDNNKCEEYSGYYKLPDSYIIRVLGLTEEEIKAAGLESSWKRSEKKRENQEKKENKRAEIIKLLTMDERLTYEKIAEIAGVSRRTICSIAKKEGLTRYKRSKKGESVKSAKNCTESVCVQVLPPSNQEAFLSTSTLWVAELELAAQACPLISGMLLRLYTEALHSSCDLLRLRVLAYMNEHGPGYVALSSENLHTAQLKDSEVIARLICDAAYGHGEFKNEPRHTLIQRDMSDDSMKKSELKKSFEQKVDWTSETKQEREGRVDKHLQNYHARDKRFQILAQTEEYQRRLEPNVIKQVEIAFMQVQRLKRDTWLIEGNEVAVKEIKQCFSELSYKDIAVCCERIGHEGTIHNAVTPFFYIIQSVWKYKHPEAADRQAIRIRKEKKEKKINKFQNFEQHDTDYDFIVLNLMRKKMGISELSVEEYQNLKR